MSSGHIEGEKERSETHTPTCLPWRVSPSGPWRVNLSTCATGSGKPSILGLAHQVSKLTPLTAGKHQAWISGAVEHLGGYLLRPV